MKRVTLCLTFMVCAFALAAQSTKSAKALFDEGNSYFKKGEYTKAFPLFLQSAEKNDRDAILFLGYCFENGRGTAVNYTKAEEWYLKGSNANSLCALYLAKLYSSEKVKGKDREDAFQWYLQAATAGNAESENMVGRYYQEGWKPAKKDEQKAMTFYEKSAKQGYSPGQYNYGWCYYYGGSVEIDYEKAFLWFSKAAEQNHNLSNFHLGLCYHYGRGVEKDLQKGFDFFYKAFEGGYDVAENWVGYYYQHGYGVEKDEQKAFEHYSNFAPKGNASAQYNLGKCYEDGIGTSINISKAIEWYKSSVRNGGQDAAKRLEYLTPDFSKMTSAELYEQSAGYLADALDIYMSDSIISHTSFIVNDLSVDVYNPFFKVPHLFDLYFDALSHAVDKGHSEAEKDMGKCYLFGDLGFTEDTPKGLSLLEKAAKKGHAEAQNILGAIYLNGYKVKQNYKTALNWYSQAAQNGNKDAMYSLAKCYKEGIGVKTDISKAIELYEKAGNNRLAFELKKEYNKLTSKDFHELGIEAFNAGSYKEALSYFEKNIHDNYMPSFHVAALCYYRGLGTEKNEQKAFELAEKSASFDNNSKFILAWTYEEGKGVQKDEQKAFQLYQELLENNYLLAYSSLASCYMYGKGTSQDMQKGFDYYLKAVEEFGNSGDLNDLGWCYVYGKGVEQDYKEAIKWFEKSIEKGNLISYVHLGNCYFYGRGVEQNYEKAISYYRLAVDGDEDEINWHSFNLLGECYLLGTGVEQNYKEAVRMFEKAASRENSYAYFNLSICYELGLGVGVNLSKSREYMQKAIDLDATIIVETKGMDTNGTWSSHLPVTSHNGQITYYMSDAFSPDDKTAIITNKTVNQITQRILEYKKMDNKVFRFTLPSLFIQDEPVTATVTKQPEIVLPSIHIITPFDNSSFNSAKMEFKYYTDTPEDAPILEMIVRVNGVLQPTSRSISSGESIELDLPQSDCNIMFQVRNKYGHSMAEVVNLKWKAPAVLQPNLYVLAIGINEYEHFPALKFPVKDMSDFVSVVKSKKNKPYRDIKVRTLTDKEATRENIAEGFNWLSEEATAMDFTFVYFAGHGTLDDKNRFYLVPVEGNKDRLYTCIRGNYFVDWLNDIPGKVVVFTDACYSGSLIEGTRSASEDDIRVLVDLMHQAKSGVALYASSDSDSVSKEHADWGNGAFTKVLLESFRGEGKDKNQKSLTTFNLMNFLNEKVHRVSKNQKPRFGVKEDFPLFFY